MKQAKLHLKIADENDIPVIIPLLRELYENSAYKEIDKFEEKDIAESLKFTTSQHLSQGCSLLLYVDMKPVGVLICSYMKHFFNQNHKTAVELAYWIQPEYKTYSTSRLLLKAYKEWAKRVGCKSYLLGKLRDNRPEETLLRKIS